MESILWRMPKKNMGQFIPEHSRFSRPEISIFTFIQKPSLRNKIKIKIALRTNTLFLRALKRGIIFSETD